MNKIKTATIILMAYLASVSIVLAVTEYYYGTPLAISHNAPVTITFNTNVTETQPGNEGVKFFGTVKKSNGVPISGITVYLFNATASDLETWTEIGSNVTDSIGQYEISYTYPNNQYALVFYKPGVDKADVLP